MSRSVPIQTNVNTDSTFFLPSGQAQADIYSTITAANYVSTADLKVSSINNTVYSPTILTGFSSITAANFVSSADVSVSTINGLVPVSFNQLSSITAANFVSSADVSVSTINGIVPLSFSQLSSLTAISTNTPTAFVSSINNLSYPPPYQPNLVVSTLTAATNISTTSGLFTQVNGATPISSFSTTSDLAVNSVTSFSWVSTFSIAASSINAVVIDARSSGGSTGTVTLGDSRNANTNGDISTVVISGPGVGSLIYISDLKAEPGPAIFSGQASEQLGGFSSIYNTGVTYSSISSYVAVISAFTSPDLPPFMWCENISPTQFCVHANSNAAGVGVNYMTIGPGPRLG